jgi:hypothetical protein
MMPQKLPQGSRALTIKPFFRYLRKIKFCLSSMWFGLASVTGKYEDFCMSFSWFGSRQEPEKDEVLPPSKEVWFGLTSLCPKAKMKTTPQ